MILSGKIYYNNYEHNIYVNALQKKSMTIKMCNLKKSNVFFTED